MKKVLKSLLVMLMFVVLAIPMASYPLRLLHEFFNSEITVRLELGTSVVVVVSTFVIASLIRAFFKIVESIKNEEK